MPLIVSRQITIDQIGCEVLSIATGSISLAIYNDDGNIAPGSRRLNAGTVSMASAGIKIISVSHTLPKGLYWLAAVATTAASVAAIIAVNPLGYDPSSWQASTGYFRDSIIPPPPDPWGTLNLLQSNTPLIFIRPSSVSAESDPRDLSFYRRIGTTLPQVYTSPAIVSVVTPATPSFSSLVLYATSFVVSKQITLDRIGCFNSSAGSGSVRLAIYNDLNLYPNSLVLDAGTLPLTAADSKFLTINQVLQPGLYWLASIADVTLAFKALAGTVQFPMLGFDQTLAGHNGFQVASSMTLPSTFPVGATRASVGARVFVRLSA